VVLQRLVAAALQVGVVGPIEQQPVEVKRDGEPLLPQLLSSAA
jgi:hypothetical protein